MVRVFCLLGIFFSPRSTIKCLRCARALVAVRKGHGWKEVAVVSMLPGQVLTPKSTKIEGYTLFWKPIAKHAWSTNDLQ